MSLTTTIVVIWLLYFAFDKNTTQCANSQNILIEYENTVSYYIQSDSYNQVTKKLIEINNISNDLIDSEIVSYIQIARSATNLFIPNESKPIVEINDEVIIVTFPWYYPENTPRYPAPEYYVKVAIEIKSKNILWGLGGG